MMTVISQQQYHNLLADLYDANTCKSYSILDVGVGISGLSTGYSTGAGPWINNNKTALISKITKVLSNPLSRISDLDSDKAITILGSKSQKILKRFVKYDICNISHRWRDDCKNKFDRIYLVNVVKSHACNSIGNISNAFPFKDIEKIIYNLCLPLKPNGEIHILNWSGSSGMHFVFGKSISCEEKINFALQMLNSNDVCAKNGYKDYDDLYNYITSSNCDDALNTIKKMKL